MGALLPLEHGHAARARTRGAVDQAREAAAALDLGRIVGRDVVDHERVVAKSRHRLLGLDRFELRPHVHRQLVRDARRLRARPGLPAGGDVVAPEGHHAHLARAVGDDHELVLVRAKAHQRRRGAGAVGDLGRGHHHATVVIGAPRTTGLVVVDLAVDVNHQTVHRGVGRHVDRTATGFGASGEAVHEHLVRAGYGVAVDDLQ